MNNHDHKDLEKIVGASMSKKIIITDLERSYYDGAKFSFKDIKFCEWYENQKQEYPNMRWSNELMAYIIITTNQEEGK